MDELKGGKNMKKPISMLALLLFFSAAFASPIAVSQEKASEKKVISLKEVTSFTYCCIPHKGPFTEIEKVIGQLMQAIQGQNIHPAGAMIGIYYNSPNEVKPEDLEWEMGFPITAQVNVMAPLQKKQWEFALVASAIHTGPYETTGQTYIKIFEWMQDNGLIQEGPVLERYLTMPTPETKPEDLKAEIWVPCRKK